VEAHTGEHCDAARRRGGPGQREKAQNNLHVRGQGGALDGLVLKEGLTQVTCARTASVVLYVLQSEVCASVMLISGLVSYFLWTR
jgi:hypothetical protein